MKKLVFLAVVLIGFTAISMAQTKKISGVPATGVIVAPTSANASADIAYVNGLEFGTITSSNLYDGSYLLKASGTVVKTNVTSDATTPKPATFTVTKLVSGTPQISISKDSFVLGTGATLYLSVTDPDYISFTAGAPGTYTVKLGARIDMSKNASITNFSAVSFDVNLNNQ